MSNDDMLNLFHVLPNSGNARIAIEGSDISIVIRRSDGMLLIGAEDSNLKPLTVYKTGLAPASKK